jgi:hypothetical protein
MLRGLGRDEQNKDSKFAQSDGIIGLSELGRARMASSAFRSLGVRGTAEQQILKTIGCHSTSLESAQNSKNIILTTFQVDFPEDTAIDY